MCERKTMELVDFFLLRGLEGGAGRERYSTSFSSCFTTFPEPRALT